ncbi:hypothetical protein ADH76_01415 [Enterocloster clostridioformis]|nr:hypothetical protein A4V08_03000 [Lachnoclostridium sp. YL32]NDO27685.1 TIGR04066 family peptide maturation system protein [Enterocloster clostridioformis]OXE70149.1 hypothetical protein ADH76_01415 [Enterocloster clostridioformis]QQR00292.1 TIGR04066 family peptide maturation system protein [Enterocloster clostridioformis]
MRKRLLVFPFNYNNYLLATNKELIKKYDVMAFVCTGNSPFNKKDAGIFVNKKTGIVISDSYLEEINKVDSVLLTSGLDEEFSDIYVEKIAIARKERKEILVTKAVLKTLEAKNILLNEIICIDGEESEGIIDTDVLYDINLPVIAVTGAGENCEKFDVQLSINRIFTERNYKVFQIGSKEYASVFGMYNWPEFVFARDISLPKKVLAFNAWIFQKILVEEPDIIILGIPGGIMPLNNRIYNYFGEVALVVSKALKVDVNVLSLYFNKDIDKEFLKNYQEFCKYAINMPTNYFNISSNCFKYDEEKNEEKIETFHLDSEYIEREFPQIVSSDIHIFNDCYRVGDGLSGDNILREFLDNIEVI